MNVAGAAAAATAGGPLGQAGPADTFAPGAPAAKGGVAESLVKLLGALVDVIAKLAQLLQPGQAAPAQSDASASAAATATASATATATATAAAAPEPAPASSSSSETSANSSAESAPPPEAQAAAPADSSGFLGMLMSAGSLTDGHDPLMFDLDGTGAGFDTTHTIGADLEGHGAAQVNDLKRGTGLLTFDATPVDGAATTHQAGAGELSHTFGNHTDLSAYGIKGDRADGSFSNGFAALRAAGEHFGMIKPGKEYLDAGDLKALEQNIGLKMRVGGLQGQDRGLADLGISRIDLGAAAATETKAQGTRDANGNVLQHQAGAAFTMNGQQRSYVDGWFRASGERSA